MPKGKAPAYGVILFLFCSTSYYVINQGSTGLSLPVNLFSWSAMALVVLFIGLNLSAIKYRITTTALPLFIIGAAVMAIPFIYADSHGMSRAGWRMAALVTGLVFYFAWMQLNLSRAQLQGLWLVLVLAACAQAVLGMVQLFLPELAWVPMKGNRPYAIFQQPNVLASFVATGLALALMLFLLPGFVLRKAWHEHCRQAFLVFSLLVMPALLVWTQSRVGWLGGALVALLFLWRFRVAAPLRCKQAAMLMILSVLTGVAVMLLSGPESILEYVTHDGSNRARWTMFRDTLNMIAERPLSGWGYGGFEYQFLHYRINQVPPTLVTEIASHPHNEFLLWWVEGGLVALLGMGLMVSGGVRLTARAWRRDRHEAAIGSRQAGEQIALCIVLLPVALHTQLEHPFYVSALHFMVFLMVMGTLECKVSDMPACKPLPRFAGQALRYMLPAASFATLTLMFFALLGGLTLTHAERGGLYDLSKVQAMPALSRWIHQDRVDFDEQVHAVMTYTMTQDESILDGYADWAQGYLMRRIDVNVYATLISILQYQGPPVLAEKYLRDAILLFPNDARFMNLSSGLLESEGEAK